jgi:hypothetical protein
MEEKSFIILNPGDGLAPPIRHFLAFFWLKLSRFSQIKLHREGLRGTTTLAYYKH